MSARAPRREFDKRAFLGHRYTPAGTSHQRTELSARHRDILRATGIAQPPLVLRLCRATA